MNFMRNLEKKHKYNAKKTIANGISFPSKAEAEYYLILEHRVKLGYIKNLKLQEKVYLSKAKILLVVDFCFERDGELIYCDVKGMTTPVFNIKARLWKAYMNKNLELVKKSGRHFKLMKVIEGKCK